MNVRVTRIHPNAVIPAYHTTGAAAFDLSIVEDVVIAPKQGAFLHTGLVFGIPEDYVFLLFARSSLYKNFGLTLANSVGILDHDFCGPEDECLIHVRNPGETPVEVKAGSRLAQALIFPRPKIEFEEGAALGPSRGGWGSTGGYDGTM